MRDDLYQAGRQKAIQAILAGLLTLGAGSLGHAQNAQKLDLPEGLSQSAINQITSLEAEKASRTPAQLKMDSQLIYAAKQAAGVETSAIAALQVNVGQDEGGNVLVDIDGIVSRSVLKQINKLGGSVVSSFPQYGTIRALLPLEQVETLAGSPDVRFIKPATQAELNGVTPKSRSRRTPLVPRARRDARLRATLPGLIQRAQARRQSLVNGSLLNRIPGLEVFSSLNLGSLAPTASSLLAGFSLNAYDSGAATNAGAVSSEGDATHRAGLARTVFGATGAAIRVGVLSDSIDDTSGSYAAALASGDVSPVTVLPGQAGSGAGEGLAMLEIVHDLAPDAQLYFATAFSGPASFAQNIRNLRAAGCDVIIDDVGYFNESPFQDDLISQAVSAVTADGALHFSSSSNSGSLAAKTSGTWEGDFNDGGPATGPLAGRAKGYRVHLFTGKDQLAGPNSPTLTQPYTAFPAVAPTAGGNRYGELFWSDPLGASTNDYDLFYLSADGTTVLASSTNAQTGTQDPYEIFALTDPARFSSFVNRRFVVVKAASAAPRFLHFDTGRGYITIATNGVTRGHSAVPAAFSTAATPAAAAANPGAGRIAAVPGPYPGPFTSSNTTEGFSSDGPRRVFYNVDGTPITPGNLSSTGGAIRLKPDITAADGVSTTLPPASGLNPFYGTSAAAPHAGAIATLLKSYNVSLTTGQVRSIFTGPAAIDIDAPGYDFVSGYGIVDAVNALSATTANPAELVDLILSPPTIRGGGTSLGTVTIKDPAPAGGTTITLSSSDPAVVVPASVTIPPGATSATFPITAAVVTTSQTVNIRATYLTQSRGALLPVLAQYNISGRVTTQTGLGVSGVTVSTQAPGDTPPAPQTNTPAAPIAIPDAPPAGSGAAVTLPITFTGSGSVSAISVGINITHTYRGDLLIALIAPDGAAVILKNPSNDDTPNYNTTFPTPTAPDQPLSTLFGKPIAGTWTLYVRDTGAGDVGTLNSFSLALTPLGAVTDSTGAYTLQNVAATTLSLSAFKAGFNFIPATRSVTVGPDATNQNFVLSQAGIRTSATVTKGSDYAVTVTLANGGADAANARITKATLGSASPTTPALPASVGTIPQGSAATIVLHFPLTVGASGATVPLRVSGSYTGGAFSGSLVVKLP